MKIAILGYGGQGQAAYEYWDEGSNEITVCDANESLKLPDNVQSHLGKEYLSGLDAYDLLIRTPALHPREITQANPDSPDILSKVTSVTNEFFRVCPTKNIIGVTGTKGKGTTSTLIARMLEATFAGQRSVHLGGNIGVPPLSMLKDNIKPDDWVVLELANFQLIDLKHSPVIAVCLMVVPEHMDWHTDYEEYVHAKQQLFAHQQAAGKAIYYYSNEDSRRIAEAGKGQKIPYFAVPGATVDNGAIIIDGQEICKTSELKLLGQHNWQNVCAAVTAVWQITQKASPIRDVLTSFTGLPHRLELVRELNGVNYYDDSFGTTPETAIVAIQAFTQPKIVILGGSDKNAKFTDLAKTVVDNNVKHVIAIGNTAEKIIDGIDRLKNKRCVEWTLLGKQTTMTEIVETARKLAEPGDVVLLSTGCASFGLFNNYKDRGEQFKQAVLALV